jgi:hypothetical protein
MSSHGGRLVSCVLCAGPLACGEHECSLRECHTLRAGRHVGLVVLVTKGSPCISLTWLLGRVRADCSNALRGAFKGGLPGLLDKLWYPYPWQVVISCWACRVLKDVFMSLREPPFREPPLHSLAVLSNPLLC